ncbi:MAG: DUF4112 domain-containing protein [Oleiphilaceae bacterium]|nr:DUF4112 domain-containing protein [Oleiphilaceae bacterium]
MQDTPQRLSREDCQASLQRLQRFAVITDSCFRIPLTRIRFGFGPILGLVPVVGDLAGLALSGYLILEARRMKAPSRLQWRMAGNALMDAVGGLLPFAGDVFDVWYKANIRNLALLTGYLETQLAPPESRKTGRLWLWLLLLALAWLLVASLLAPPG